MEKNKFLRIIGKTGEYVLKLLNIIIVLIVLGVIFFYVYSSGMYKDYVKAFHGKSGEAEKVISGKLSDIRQEIDHNLSSMRSGAAKTGETMTAPSPAGKEASADYYYTCPMHPQVIENKPGQCPICGMTLVRKKRSSAAPAPSLTPAALHKTGEKMEMKMSGTGESMGGLVTIDSRMRQILGVTTGKVSYRDLTKKIITVGHVAYDEKSEKVISSWISGRIDRLYVDFTGTVVGKGEKLASVYSPELVSTQKELLLSLEYLNELKSSNSDPEAVNNAAELVKAAETRLRLWGITEDQIKKIEKSKEVLEHLYIVSPAAGTVIEKSAFEGMYIAEGTTLFKIADLSTVWINAEIFEQDMEWVKMGQEVKLSTVSNPGSFFYGRISFIEPYMNDKTRTLKVRIEAGNPGGALKPGMYVDARLEYPVGRVLAIPDVGVIRTGEENYAVLDLGDGKMMTKKIDVGEHVDGYFKVLSGLKEGQKIITSANFLIDSESRIKSSMEGGGGMEGMPGMEGMQH